MVSVALMVRRGGPIPRSMWTQRELKIARRAARHTLYGVGDGSTDLLKDGDVTLVIRRQCQVNERRRVVEPYLVV